MRRQPAAAGEGLLRERVAELRVHETELGLADPAQRSGVPRRGVETADDAEARAAHAEDADTRSDGEEVRRGGAGALDARIRGHALEEREPARRNDDDSLHGPGPRVHGTRSNRTLCRVPPAMSHPR